MSAGLRCVVCEGSAELMASNTGKQPWSTSTRRQRLPSDWPKRRAVVKRRAQGQCQAQVHEPDCPRIGTECDHIIAGDDHSLSNLQWLSGPCHRAKTLAEAVKGRARPTKRRPTPIGLVQDQRIAPDLRKQDGIERLSTPGGTPPSTPASKDRWA
jgi:5-methylcytosine-specific restriction protein A